MKMIDSIIPAYWEIWDSLSQLDLQFIAFTLVAFCLGFLMAWVLEKRLMNNMLEEIEDLRMHVLGAERLLGIERPSEPREEIPVVEAEVANENASHAIISYREMVDTDITDKPDTLEDLEPVDLREMYHKPKHRNVIVTKVVGPKNSGTRLQTPESGFEIKAPVVGKRYLVELDRGRLLRTSVVTRITPCIGLRS